MNVTTDHANGIAIVRVGESRLMYPLLSEFASVVTQLVFQELFLVRMP